MALLTPEPLGFKHRQALDADLLQRLLHIVEFERLYDGFYFFHVGHS